MQNTHIQSRFDGLNVVAIACNIEVIAHTLFFKNIAVVIDVDAIVHNCVVVGPPEVPGEPHHERPTGHGLVDFNGMRPCRLRGVERYLVIRIAKGPGDVNIVPPDAIAHDGRPIGSNRHQMLVAGPPGSLCLDLTALFHRELDGLHELHIVLLARHIANALDENAVAPTCRARYRDHTVRQQSHQTHANSASDHAFNQIAAGYATALGSQNGIPCRLWLAFINRLSRHQDPSVSLDDPSLFPSP